MKTFSPARLRFLPNLFPIYLSRPQLPLPRDIVRAQWTALRSKGGEDVTVALSCYPIYFLRSFFALFLFFLVPSRVLHSDPSPTFPFLPFVFPFAFFAESHSFYRSCVLSSKVSSRFRTCTLSRSLVHALLSHSLSLSFSLVLPFVCALVEAFTSLPRFDSHPERDYRRVSHSGFESASL